jgi:hydrogenase/urease accessory protein HupE
VASQLWEVQVVVSPRSRDSGLSGEALTPNSVRVQLLAGDNVSFTVTFLRPTDTTEKINLRATKLGELPAGHRQFVLIGDAAGITLAKKLLSAKDDALDVPWVPDAARGLPPGAGPEPQPTFWSFIRLGVEHIWTGYDHLLFLFALLVVCRTFRSIVVIITCFTLAHSLTLALATLNIVNLPARITEPAIAASIVYVGVENLLRRGEEPKGRWALTFAFGLIHGFGFASVLRELGVGEGGSGIAMPLFTFNAGVELGQIAIAAAALPIVWRLRKNEKFVQRGVPALSALVAAAGLYWFLKRTVWPWLP